VWVGMSMKVNFFFFADVKSEEAAVLMRLSVVVHRKATRCCSGVVVENEGNAMKVKARCRGVEVKASGVFQRKSARWMTRWIHYMDDYMQCDMVC
jgi:hypothetical protein